MTVAFPLLSTLNNVVVAYPIVEDDIVKILVLKFPGLAAIAKVAYGVEVPIPTSSWAVVTKVFPSTVSIPVYSFVELATLENKFVVVAKLVVEYAKVANDENKFVELAVPAKKFVVVAKLVVEYANVANDENKFVELAMPEKMFVVVAKVVVEYVAKRLVCEAFVEKKFVEVAFVDVELRAVRLMIVEEAETIRPVVVVVGAR